MAILRDLQLPEQVEALYLIPIYGPVVEALPLRQEICHPESILFWSQTQEVVHLHPRR